MYVEEINAKGGVLGRKLELVVRDTKGNADEAVRVARDLILRENVDFLVGTLTSAEGPAVSPVAKENKIVFVVPVVKTDQLVTPANLHPYVFRTASNTTIEGRSAAEIMAKWQVKSVATMSQDYAFGQDVTRAFVAHLKKLRPDIEIVDQQWPKLGEADYTPFINAQMAKKADAVFTSLWGGHFVTFVKQAKPLRYFEAVKSNVVAAGEAGAIETAKAMGDDYPLGITANAYDAFNWDGGQAHKDYTQRLRVYLKEEHPSSWPITGYIGMQVLVAAIQKAGSTDSEKVVEGDAQPHGRHADRQADDPEQGPTGEPRAVLGQDDQGSALSVRGDEPADVRRSDAVHGLTDSHAGRPTEDPRRDRWRQERHQGARHPRDLASARGPVSASDIARATGFNVSTAFRQLQTLVQRGYVEQDPGHRGYVMGPRFYQLASAYLKGSDLATIARPHLEALRDAVGETAYLVILSQGEIVQLCKADGQHVVSASIRTAQREPAYCTATGKVLLSGLAPDALARYLGAVKLAAYTPQTITAKAKLQKELAAVRAQGYALDLEEYAENLCCISVPVRDAARRRDRSPRSAWRCRSSASAATSCRAGARNSRTRRR